MIELEFCLLCCGLSMLFHRWDQRHLNRKQQNMPVVSGAFLVSSTTFSTDFDPIHSFIGPKLWASLDQLHINFDPIQSYWASTIGFDGPTLHTNFDPIHTIIGPQLWASLDQLRGPGLTPPPDSSQFDPFKVFFY